MSYVVVRSAELRQLVQSYLKAGPTAEYDGYAIYRVDDAIGSEQADPNRTCPLKIGSRILTPKRSEHVAERKLGAS